MKPPRNLKKYFSTDDYMETYRRLLEDKLAEAKRKQIEREVKELLEGIPF